MGQSSAETVREIEDTRSRIEGDIRALEQRLPAPAVWTKRAIGFLAGGGIATTAVLVALKRRSKKKKAAKAVAVPAVVQVLPEQWAERVSDALEDGAWKGYVAIAAGAWLVFRLAELRQLRRINKSLLPTIR